MRASRPLCFVLMPFGTKRDPTSSLEINFDVIYEQAVRPAVLAAGLEVVRADEERIGGIMHKPMFERLLLCEYAIADLTTGNANVYYQLGIRHAIRPFTTLAIYADQQRLPFDLTILRALPYRFGDANRFGAREAGDLTSKLTVRLSQLRTEGASTNDSPLFQLLTGYGGPDLAHLETDVFRDQVEYSSRAKRELAKGREFGDVQAVERVEAGLGDLKHVEAGVLVDLYLTWRALSQWESMLGLYERLPAPLKRSILVREQLGFALNRLGRRSDALRVLEDVLTEQGPNSETLGLIGRIYKDQWMDAKRRDDTRMAVGHLERAIDAYVRGFEADSRDAYPGINAVTLLDIKGDEPALRLKEELLPVVRFAVKQRLRGAKPIYWDYATLLELSVLEGHTTQAMRCLSDALVSVREPWEARTTAANLQFIFDSRAARGSAEPWLADIIAELHRRGSIAEKS
jgi:hypothetical protein